MAFFESAAGLGRTPAHVANQSASLMLQDQVTQCAVEFGIGIRLKADEADG